MKFARFLVSLAALLPVLVAGYWTSFASPWPEPVVDRLALREVTPRWQLAQWADFAGEPMHFVPRVLQLGALEIPGATVASAAWVNALLAVLLALALAGLLRRVFALTGFAAAVALALAGLLAAAPANGANWLHGERLGVFLPPLLLLVALSWLQRERFFGLRAFAAIVLAAIAPFCHSHGVLVFLALLPSLLAAARRAGSSRGLAWIGCCLIAGNLAAVASLQAAGGIAAAGAAWPARLIAACDATAIELLQRTGATWLDLLPGTRLDEVALGALSWSLPLLLWRIGDRSPPARGVAAPWWGCFWFGLLVVVWDTLRYDTASPVGTWREATYGAFLLPVGAIGVAAARFGPNVLRVAAGAVAVLAVQDWWHGLEQLRLARMHVEQRDAHMALPASFVPPDATVALTPEALAVLQQRGWIPPAGDNGTAALADVLAGPSSPELGTCNGGDTTRVHGTLRSSLRNDSVQWVFVVAVPPGAEPLVLGRTLPDFAAGSRDVPWQVTLDAPITAAGVRAVGYVPRRRQFVALGTVFMPRNGALVPGDVQ